MQADSAYTGLWKMPEDNHSTESPIPCFSDPSHSTWGRE